MVEATVGRGVVMSGIHTHIASRLRPFRGERRMFPDWVTTFSPGTLVEHIYLDHLVLGIVIGYIHASSLLDRGGFDEITVLWSPIRRSSE